MKPVGLREFISYYWNIYRFFIVGVLVSIVLYFVSHIEKFSVYPTITTSLQFLSSILLQACFVTLVYEIVVRNENDQKISSLIKESLDAKLYPALGEIHDNILESIHEQVPISHKSISCILNDDEVEKLLKSCLEKKLHDISISNELYSEMISPIIQRFNTEHARKYIEGYNCTVTLSKLNELNPLYANFYGIRVTVDYTFKLNTDIIRIGCTNGDYRFGDEENHLEPFYMYTLPFIDDCFFEKVFIVDNVEMIIDNKNISLDLIRTINDKKGHLIYEYSNIKCANLIGKKIRMKYSFRSIIFKWTVFKIKMTVPTNRLFFNLNTGNTGINSLKITDYFVGSANTSIENFSNENYCCTTLTVDGWIFPKCGATISWFSHEFKIEDIYKRLSQLEIKDNNIAI